MSIIISIFSLCSWLLEIFRNFISIFTGFFDQLRITLFLKREIRYYMMEYYFPIISAVFLSFVSFWIAHESAPARVSLPVTTFLTLSAMLDHVRTSAGYFGTADAVEIFLNVSIVFVFFVMVEYGIVEAVTFKSEEVWGQFLFTALDSLQQDQCLSCRVFEIVCPITVVEKVLLGLMN